ncbi:hypothetical protein LJC24_04210 [Desulfococcaceae bacterium OttesenSCG-928-F15]|nr:hypothetical protein [Desulfococcaceae bacterium OttesenSCG-928-F15]
MSFSVKKPFLAVVFLALAVILLPHHIAWSMEETLELFLNEYEYFVTKAEDLCKKEEVEQEDLDRLMRSAQELGALAGDYFTGDEVISEEQYKRFEKLEERLEKALEDFQVQ